MQSHYRRPKPPVPDSMVQDTMDSKTDAPSTLTTGTLPPIPKSPLPPKGHDRCTIRRQELIPSSTGLIPSSTALCGHNTTSSPLRCFPPTAPTTRKPSPQPSLLSPPGDGSWEIWTAAHAMIRREESLLIVGKNGWKIQAPIDHSWICMIVIRVAC
jgi:hypothetical protein